MAVPLLDVLKQGELKYRPFKGQIAVGAEMAELMGHGDISRLAVSKASKSGGAVTTESSFTNEQLIAQAAQRATNALTHPPRPRKKRR